MKEGDCFIRPALGGRSRSIWRIVSVEGDQCRADLYDFGDQGIYCYKAEPFSVKRFASFIPVSPARFERVADLYAGGLRTAEDIISKAGKWKTENLQFGTCLYSETPGYKGIMKLISQSGDNSMLGEYIHVSQESFSRETIRPGICSLSQYEEDDTKLSIETDVYDKLLKVLTLTYASILSLVNLSLQEYRKAKGGA